MSDEIKPSWVSSQTDEQLILIVENPRIWDEPIVKAAEQEVANRGGLKTLKEGVEEDEEFEKENEKARAKQGNGYMKLGMVFIIVLGLTLPFHYVLLPANPSVFPKENLSLSNTFIFDSDIDKILTRYNNADYQEQLLIRQESLFKKLFEKGYIEKTEKEKLNDKL
jgi:hypothetical protein